MLYNEILNLLGLPATVSTATYIVTWRTYTLVVFDFALEDRIVSTLDESTRACTDILTTEEQEWMFVTFKSIKPRYSNNQMPKNSPQSFLQIKKKIHKHRGVLSVTINIMYTPTHTHTHTHMHTRTHSDLVITNKTYSPTQPPAEFFLLPLGQSHSHVRLLNIWPGGQRISGHSHLHLSLTKILGWGQ